MVTQEQRLEDMPFEDSLKKLGIFSLEKRDGISYIRGCHKKDGRKLLSSATESRTRKKMAI